jgi:hypothetical protein
MTKSEYSQLLKKSHIYAGLSPAIKKRVKNAAGEEMTRYALILGEANRMMEDAAQELQSANEETLLRCRENVKKLGKERVQSVENKSRAEEEKHEDKILEQLKNI